MVDPPLTDLGHEQATRMAEALAGESFDEVLVSPLRRARQTAAPLYEALGRSEHDRALVGGDPRPGVARDAGREGATGVRRVEGARRSTERWDGLVGGESIREFTDRIHTGAAEFLGRPWHRPQRSRTADLDSRANYGKRIALVAHAGTNSVTIGHLLGLDPTPWEWDRFVLGHASISRVEALPRPRRLDVQPDRSARTSNTSPPSDGVAELAPGGSAAAKPIATVRYRATWTTTTPDRLRAFSFQVVLASSRARSRPG